MLTTEQRISAGKLVGRNDPGRIRDTQNEEIRLLMIAAYLSRPETSDGNSERLRASTLDAAIGAAFFDMYWYDYAEVTELAAALVEQGYLLLEDGVGVLVGAPREAEVRDICDLADMYEYITGTRGDFRVSWLSDEALADTVARTAAPGTATAIMRGVRAVLPTVDIDPSLMATINRVVEQILSKRPSSSAAK